MRMTESRIKTAAPAFLLPILLASCKKDDPVELPNVDEIAEMRVDIKGVNRAVSNWKSEESEALKFSAPREHWAAILDTFRPYERGIHGKKGWVPEGNITLTLKDGRKFQIRLLLFGEDDVMQPRFGPKRIDHVGGSKRKLYDAPKAAEKAGQKG